MTLTFLVTFRRQSSDYLIPRVPFAIAAPL